MLALEERDRQEPRDRRRLDREIGARHADAVGEGTTPSAASAEGRTLLRLWLEQAPSLGLQERIRRVRSSLSLLRGLLLGVGLFMGWAAAAALLQVEVHAGRINVVLCLGLLVALPAAMLVVACGGAFWARVGLRVGSRDGTGLVGGLRKLALARGAMRLLPQSVRQDVDILLGRLTAHSRLYARAQRAQLFVWSQWVGLAFSIGALSAMLAFVVFTDLAFGWSTTLDVSAASVHRLVSIVSSPWSSLWPDAVPSLDLVETTRHFRVSEVRVSDLHPPAGGTRELAVADPHIHFVDPILYGGWWPFLVAALIAYGLLPRLLAVAFGSWWLSREVATAIALTPGVDRLLERLTTPFVETQATSPEREIGHAETGLVPLVSAGDWIRDRAGGGDGEEPIVIRWAEASHDDALVEHLGTPRLQVRDAGGRRSLAEDAALVAACGAGQGGVALCVRAYEPPVLDVLDFLGELRRAIGQGRELCVLLEGGTPADHEAWRHKLVGLGDPGLCVARLDSKRTQGGRRDD